jgi:hypothetical protein
MTKVTIDGKTKYFENDCEAIIYVQNRMSICKEWSIEKVEDGE